MARLHDCRRCALPAIWVATALPGVVRVVRAGPVRVTVAGVPSQSGVAYSYNGLRQPPRVVSVVPLVGPASGGTLVTVLGELFGDSATVTFVERAASGALTGNRSECVWRGVPGMGCSDSTIQCRAPPLANAGRSFDVSVAASGASTVFLTRNPSVPSRWTYEDPVVAAISPSELPPQPTAGANITISGRNFGALRGAVTAGHRTLVCPMWSDGSIVCAQPPGVTAAANVAVTVASGVASSQAGNATLLTFLPPAVSAVAPASVVSGTAGGGHLNVTGANFAAPLPVSAWLVRWRGTYALPWSYSGPEPSRDALECPVIPGTVTPTSLACVVPPGTGTGWGLVVVNRDDAAAAGPNATEAAMVLLWRASTPAPNFSLAYAPPVLASVQLQAGGGGAPALGGFSLRLTGTDFGAPAPLVTLGTLPCSVLPGTHSHGVLVCMAPLRQVDSDSLVRVTVDGRSSGPLDFAYDPPVVARVSPGDMLALAPARRTRLTLHGVNFGDRYRADARSVHVVRVGPLACVDVVWTGDAELSCVPEGEVAAGPVNVTLTLAGDTTAPVPVMAGCPVSWYARIGNRCAPCPSGARCDGGVSEPVSLPGHFPLSMAVFVECVPRAACAGGIAAIELASRGSADSTGCSRLYRGDRCAQCAVGAYRLKGKCASCPNTAWLLFLGFALAITAAVAAAVYLAGKRINMAGLSIGVVRVNSPCSALARDMRSPCVVCLHQCAWHELRVERVHCAPRPLLPRTGLCSSAGHVRGL